MATPYIGFTNKTMDAAPELGPTANCPKCNKECEIKDSNPPMLQFINCCGSSYLVGIEGKDVSVQKPDVSGDIHLVGSKEVK